MTPPHSSIWAEVTRQEPCQACGRGDFCRVSSDGAFLCRRAPFEGSLEKLDKNGVPFWVGFPGGVTPTAPVFEADTGPQAAPPDQLHQCYAELLSHLTLSPEHLKQMLARGFTGEDVTALGVRTLDQAGRQVAKHLAERFSFWQSVPGLYVKDNGRTQLGGWSGLLIPCRDLQGRIIALRIRADSPEAPRYSWLSSERHGGPGPGSPLSFWPGAGGAGLVRVTEGELKAALAALRTGVPTIAAPGVGLFGSVQVLEWLLKLTAARVAISPDADFRTNLHVCRAVETAIKRLQTVPYQITVETWDPSAKGIDDALLAGLTIQPIQPEEFFAMTTVSTTKAGPTNGTPPPKRFVPVGKDSMGCPVNAEGQREIDAISSVLRAPATASAEALTLPPFDSLPLLERAVLTLLSLCDGGEKNDKQGFNRSDSKWFKPHKASIRAGTFTDPDLRAEALDRITVYSETQLEPNGFKLAEIQAEEANNEDWGAPLPLTQTEEAEPFPMEALGAGPFRKYVEELAQYSATPPEVSVFSCLAIANASPCKKVRVESGQGRDMPINLQVLIVAESGDGKSTAMEVAAAPFKDVERSLQEQHKNAKLVRESLCAEIEERLADLPKNDPERKALKRELAQVPQVPDTPPRLLSSDPSAEAMEPLLSRNTGAICVLNAEAREFLEGLAGSHRQGIANLKPLLCGFSGEDWQTDRITRTGENIRKPSVSMVLMSQPSVVERLVTVKDFSERGAMARMLLAWPAPPKEIPPSTWERRGMSCASVDYWKRVIYALANISVETEQDSQEPIPRRIPMSPGARNLAVEFFRASYDASRGDGVLASLPATGKRLAELAQRVAASLHLIDLILTNTEPWETAITADTYSRAVTIVRWSIEAVLEVNFSALGARTVNPAHAKVWKLVQSMIADGAVKFSVKKVHDKIRGQAQFRSAKTVRAALKMLAEMNYIRFASSEDKRGGRRSETFLINPVCLNTGFASANTQNPEKPRLHAVFERGCPFPQNPIAYTQMNFLSANGENGPPEPINSTPHPDDIEEVFVP